MPTDPSPMTSPKRCAPVSVTCQELGSSPGYFRKDPLDRSTERLRRGIDLNTFKNLEKLNDELLEKLNANDVKVGLGYVCVRNQINDVTYDKARIQEAKLFETHPLLSKIDKSMVGTPVLAQKLVKIQSIIGSLKEPLQNVFIRDEFKERYLDNKKNVSVGREAADGIRLPDSLQYYACLYLIESKLNSITDLR
ncbi:dynamin-related protein 4C-like protein [Tanacetum coccineum]